MKKLTNKGQGAMEYLMTYGWAILVVMIVGIVMWQLGIFNMGSTAVTASGFSRLKPQLAAVAMVAGGDSTFVFTNGAGATITLLSAGVETDLAPGRSAVAQTDFVGTTSGAGDNFYFTVSPPGTATASAGDPVVATVDITYTISVAGDTVGHVEHGTIRGPLE